MVRILALSLVVAVDAACVGRPGLHRAAAPAAHTAPMTADEMVRRVRDAYRNTPGLVARFRLTTVNKTFGLPFAHDGKLYFRSPDKVRLDFFSRRGPHSGQVARSQLYNGNTGWAIDVRGKWYVEHRAKSAPPVFLFLTDPFDLSSDFHARLLTGSTHGGAGDTVLDLTPLQPSAPFRSLVLVVDPTTLQVKRSIVTSAAGDTSELSIFAPDATRRVADSWFVFDPKAAAAWGFRRVRAGQVPPRAKPRPVPAPSASRERVFLSDEWLRAYHDCDHVRRAKPPREHPPSLADMQRCAFPAAETTQQFPSHPANRP